MADTTAMDVINEPNSQEAALHVLDAEPEVPAQSTEVAGEDEWGAPSKKKKGKKGKKQDDDEYWYVRRRALAAKADEKGRTRRRTLGL